MHRRVRIVVRGSVGGDVVNQVPLYRLIIFTRYPEPGRVKTRLIPALGADGAAELHRRLTVKTLEVADATCGQMPELDVEVRFTGGSEWQMRQMFGAKCAMEEQGEGDLGARLARAMRAAFDAERNRVVAIGTDCPELSAATLRAAFDALAAADAVLGPASDGGYYLIGLSRMVPELFEEISWGTGKVLARTMEAARRVEAGVQVLPVLSDVDRPEDLERWGWVKKSPHPQPSPMSIWEREE